jgi:diketogulonate reductase-like aldo/keto reductase
LVSQTNTILQIKPVTNQVECHPFFAQEKLRAFMVSRGVIMTGYSPLAASHGHWPRPAEASNLLQDPKLTAIGQKYGKSPAQVVLRWMVILKTLLPVIFHLHTSSSIIFFLQQTQRGIVAVPKSATPSRIAANIDVFDFRLTDEEMKTVNGFDLGHPKGRFLKGHLGEDLNCKHKHFPFGIEF